jgi:hypothetical protein
MEKVYLNIKKIIFGLIAFILTLIGWIAYRKIRPIDIAFVNVAANTMFFSILLGFNYFTINKRFSYPFNIISMFFMPLYFILVCSLPLLLIKKAHKIAFINKPIKGILGIIYKEDRLFDEDMTQGLKKISMEFNMAIIIDKDFMVYQCFKREKGFELHKIGNVFGIFKDKILSSADETSKKAFGDKEIPYNVITDIKVGIGKFFILDSLFYGTLCFVQDKKKSVFYLPYELNEEEIKSQVTGDISLISYRTKRMDKYDKLSKKYSRPSHNN